MRFFFVLFFFALPASFRYILIIYILSITPLPEHNVSVFGGSHVTWIQMSALPLACCVASEKP